jgi:3-isopropylmalate dehydrogenase
MTRLLLLPGDGIGPEIVAAARRVIEAADRRFALGLALETAEIGFRALETVGTTMPDAVLQRARAVDGIVLGPVSHNAYPPREAGGVNPSALLRTRLDLFANIRPARIRRGLPAPVSAAMDLVIFRENTEGFYADRNMASGSGEFLADPDMALALRKITRRASARIAEAAFAEARKRPARHVTAVHKANVLRLSDGLFLEETRRVAAANPDIAYDEVLVDAMAAHLVRDPGRFDVIVTTNMFGDILSDLASELSGGLGIAASLNEGADHAMAQAQHGSAPDIAGSDTANPAALIGSVALLFDWIGRRSGRDDFRAAARAITEALDDALADPEVRTPDHAGSGSTSGMAKAISQSVAEEAR